MRAEITDQIYETDKSKAFLERTFLTTFFQMLPMGITYLLGNFIDKKLIKLYG